MLSIFGGGCGNMLRSTDLPSVIVAAPADGTVVRWRLQGASAVPGYSLDVLHRNPNGTFKVTAPTGSLTPAGVEIETSATSLPIHAGEYIDQQGQLSTLSGVPRLSGKRLKSAKKKIRSGDCRVGAVKKKRGAAAKTGKVVHQGPRPGRSLPAGSKVSVTLG